VREWIDMACAYKPRILNHRADELLERTLNLALHASMLIQIIKSYCWRWQLALLASHVV